jgi:hypothetical protein
MTVGRTPLRRYKADSIEDAAQCKCARSAPQGHGGRWLRALLVRISQIALIWRAHAQERAALHCPGAFSKHALIASSSFILVRPRWRQNWRQWGQIERPGQKFPDLGGWRWGESKTIPLFCQMSQFVAGQGIFQV